MKWITYIAILFCFQSIGAQKNLVINPGFEETNYTSNGTRQLKKVGYLSNYWYSPLHKRSPQLFMEPERSVAKANSGYNAIGMVLGSSKQEKTNTEFITGQLSQPLVKGQAYCISFSVLLHRSSKWAAADLGILLHHDRDLITNTEDLTSLKASLYAEDGKFVTATKWIRYNGYYVASGGEQFITLGKFGSSEAVEMKELGYEPYFQVDGLSSKAFYQFDDVTVIAQGEGVECGCAEPPLTEEEIQSDRNGLRPYLFALDASGSMKRGGVFDTLRINLVSLLEELPLGTPVTFSTFSSDASLIFSGRLDVNTSHKVDSLLGLIELKGGTSVLSGLENASRSWDVGRDSARLILISDGSLTVSNSIEAFVKNQYESKGRMLTVIQIANKPKGAERLEPYQASFLQVALSELRSALFQMHHPTIQNAVACPCANIYTDTMNYHFVIDYSGSMKISKNRAKKAVLNLYEQAPPTAVISITAFSEEATQLFMGRKSDMSLDELEKLLESHNAKGGTDPAPGVKHGLSIAQNMASLRFSHLILVTDLEPLQLNENYGLKGEILKMSKNIDLAVSVATVDLESSIDLLVSGRSQFDITSGTFREVSKQKFEKDLFDTTRSGCDYTTQPYHYNPAGDIAKDASKKTLRLILRELLGVGVSISTG
ncbi:MAG: VWA domain-containing protein [Flavobacteriales bacterium]|nr:VWA domain-containing protein [Flavobacteriales bacterium]